jgi:hypothetical protein
MEVHNLIGRGSWMDVEYSKKCRVEKSKTHEV